MKSGKWLLLALLLSVVGASVISRLSAAPADPVDQLALNHQVIYRVTSDTTRQRVASGNAKAVLAVPDSTNGLSAVDTTGYGFRLTYDATSKSWVAPAWKRYPISSAGRQAHTIYLASLNPSTADTAVARGVVLDQTGPMIQSVDSVAIEVQQVKPIHADTTVTSWSFAGATVGPLEAKEVQIAEYGLHFNYGTVDATGQLIRLNGSHSGSDLGTAIALNAWSGPGIVITRNASSTASGSDAIAIDMSSDVDLSQAYGVDIDAGGNGAMGGLRVRVPDGYRDFDQYGIISDIQSGATGDSNSTAYAGHFTADATVNTGSKNIAIHAMGDTANSGRAIESWGNVEMAGHTGGASSTDSLWVRMKARLDSTLVLGGFIERVASRKDTIFPATSTSQAYVFAGVDTSFRCWVAQRGTAAGPDIRPWDVEVTDDDEVTVTCQSGALGAATICIWCER